ncbi:MAG: ECF transporter S component [Clostridia bacterium]|nr:ECF transporter S component [Clostridia bacterium]
MQMSSVKKRKKLSVKVQMLATFAAIVAAVALPQIFHVMGSVSGIGTALGETFLPMHLPIILVGLLAGRYAGAVAGFIAPLVSFALTGMPKAAMLPFVVIELCVYGLCAGVLRDVKMSTFFKVVITQFVGRGVRAVAILIATYVFSSSAVPVSVIWNSIVVGLFGLVLQWALIPLVVYRVENLKNNE